MADDDAKQDGEDSEAEKPKRKRASRKKKELQKCGIVMPISAIDGCSEKHWQEVRRILADAATMADMDARLVSEGDDSELIQARIAQNLHADPMAIADLSCLNPNVMFELGMRLTFNKTVVLVKDKETKSPFDISGIEYVEYPRNLRYWDVEDFKERLCDKLKRTLKASQKPEYSTYLSLFGKFEVFDPGTESVGIGDAVLKQMEEMNRRMSRIEQPRTTRVGGPGSKAGRRPGGVPPRLSEAMLDNLISDAVADATRCASEGNMPYDNPIVSSIALAIFDSLLRGRRLPTTEKPVEALIEDQIRKLDNGI